MIFFVLLADVLIDATFDHTLDQQGNLANQNYDFFQDNQTNYP